jgi:hypothetical protein
MNGSRLKNISVVFCPSKKFNIGRKFSNGSGSRDHRRNQAFENTADFAALVIPYALVARDTFAITKSEIKKYYDDNRENFHVKETRTLDFVTFDTKPSPADTFAAIQQIETIRERLAHGEDFATLASENTEDPSGSANGGDLVGLAKALCPGIRKSLFSLAKARFPDRFIHPTEFI